MQVDLFEDPHEKPPLLVAYGMGVDSTAVLVRLHEAGIRPDAILFADTGSEKQVTYDYQPVIEAWLGRVGFPRITVVRKKQSTRQKNWPTYSSLGEKCLTNAGLPSLAFGFKSCSINWKVEPQNAWTKRFAPAQRAWRREQKVRKIIGYDASPKDRRRFAIAVGVEDPLYDYWYPLIEWDMDREACKAAIADAGLPVPAKSACSFCPASKPHELHDLPVRDLVLIVAMEARAEPHLTKIDGLWRTGTKGTRGGIPKPGRMTDYIREHELLPPHIIDRIQEEMPTERIRAADAPASAFAWHDLIEAFTDEDALHDQGDRLSGSFIPLPVLS